MFTRFLYFYGDCQRDWEWTKEIIRWELNATIVSTVEYYIYVISWTVSDGFCTLYISHRVQFYASKFLINATQRTYRFVIKLVSLEEKARWGNYYSVKIQSVNDNY